MQPTLEDMLSGIYEQFGVTPGINARGNQTLLGGSTPPPEIQEAMDEAMNSGYVVFEELLRKTGDFIAKTLGTEQAFVTSGAAAAISLGTAAALAGHDRDKMSKIPDTSTFDRNELVFQKGQDYTYKRCFTLAGARLVEIGREDGCTVEEMEAAIGPKTAGIAFYESGQWGDEWVSIEEARALADKHDIRLIVDAAGQIYPLDQFTRVAQLGDVVAFGAKYIGSPHSTGICTGRAEYMESAFLQNFIGYELAGMQGLPRPYGRPYKTDRSEVIGVAAALRRWFSINHEERLAIEEAKRTAFHRALNDVAGVSVVVPTKAQLGPNVTVFIHFDKGVLGFDGHEVIKRLEQGDPPIWTRTHDDGGSIGVGVQMLSDEEVETVVQRIKEIVS
jgi:L-seryl-tRNA(Ser) seleniumtransferase